MVNKAMITLHIVAYLVIIISNVLTTVIPKTNLRTYGITIICNQAVFSVCEVIFGLIINQLATKILAINAYSKSLPP